MEPPFAGEAAFEQNVFFHGGVGIAVGMLSFLALMGMLPTVTRSPNDAPDWFGILFDLAFLFAGTDQDGNLLATAPRSVRFVNEGSGLLIVVSLATLFTWVAFGLGERHFIISAGGFARPAGTGGDMVGRAMFGVAPFLAGFWSVRWFSSWRAGSVRRAGNNDTELICCGNASTNRAERVK